jgi:hypothetical protein
MADYRRDQGYVLGLGAAAAASAANAADGSDQVVEMAFWYTSPAIVLTALQGPLTFAIPINADSDFMALWLVANSTGSFSFAFQDNATGRSFMPSQVNNVNIFGTAQLPFPMLPPYTFQRQGSIGLTVTDTSNAGNTIQIVFAGKKIFPNQAAGANAPTVAAS